MDMVNSRVQEGAMEKNGKKKTETDGHSNQRTHKDYMIQSTTNTQKRIEGRSIDTEGISNLGTTTK